VIDVPVQAVCLPGVAAGLRLAGVDAMEVDRVEAGVRWLNEAINQRSEKVLLVQESIHEALPTEVRARLARRPLPMIVSFPDPRWEPVAEPEAYIIELLRRAIGYRVRLR
jgi:vacuolar-type H+-ATPase subunit F/Vma7